ncbi:MAG: hypothetical protein M0D57_13075 [Sphingobacteriales bacterium JAD_PAG50586_3]|nr:MAG: hypothetical protein M0D57_13075 [Sphingobacteriales bacterium JAD_PAG50586_3]
MKNFLLILLVALTGALQAQTTGGGLIYGKNHVYALAAPKDWIMDNKAGVPMDLHAVFYPVGGSWLNSETIMYTNFITVDSSLTLKEFIADDVKAFRKNGDEKIEFKEDLVLAKPTFTIYYFEYTADNIRAYEYIAYTRGTTGVVTLVLHTRDKKELKKNYKALEELAKSYLWISNGVVEKE